MQEKPHEIDLRGDNVAPAAPQILAALVAANQGNASPYGEDEWSLRLDAVASDRFGQKATVMPTSTGIAANALAIAVLAGAGAGIFCHRKAHILTSENGAVPFFSRGAELVPIDGPAARMQVSILDNALRQNRKPAVVSLTQATEAGTVYSFDDLAAISRTARRHDARMHIDGARLANALATLHCSIAEFARISGADALTFGASKNGLFASDAVIFFGAVDRDALRALWRKVGQLSSKMRYAAAQLLAYIEDDRWLGWANHANAMALRLAAGLADLPGVKLVWPVEANEVFAVLPAGMRQAFDLAGILYRDWPADGATRLVCPFDISTLLIDRVVAIARKSSGPKLDSPERA